MWVGNKMAHPPPYHAIWGKVRPLDDPYGFCMQQAAAMGKNGRPSTKGTAHMCSSTKKIVTSALTIGNYR
jgi:hypothetical protein